MRTSRCSPGPSPGICTACGTTTTSGWRSHCLENQIPLIDIASKLRDEHFADELHPNDEGAKVIARRF